MKSIRIMALSLALSIISSAAFAEVEYRVKVNPTDRRYEVTMTVPTSGPDPLVLQIPNWAPGAYVLRDGGTSVHDLTVTDAAGSALAVARPDDSTWAVAAPGDGQVTVKYWIASSGGRFGGGARDETFFQLSGPAAYLYVLGRKKERCKVTFDVPNNWPVVCGLDVASGPPNTYSAPTYDVLADNPMSTGDIVVDHYNLRGKEHYVVLEGPGRKLINHDEIMKDCRFVSAAETDFWGGAPYHKYVWHFIVMAGGRGGGGLEHLSSTQITLSSDLRPATLDLLAHEYFHLWNVKRIRARALGPFDYEHLPKTGALWWLEGVTDYYAYLLPYRYGAWERPMFFDGLVGQMRAIENNPARLTVSANEASMRVGDANGGRGNSNGYQISYYNLGWLCGMCLDTEIRARTNGRHSLDDVAHALFQECKNDKPGFAEDEIRNLCMRFGGPSLGAFYDRVVMTPGELPIAEQLAKMGLRLDAHDETYTEAGWAPAFGGPGGGGGGIRVGQVRGPASGKLETGDQIEAINGTSLSGKPPMDSVNLIRTTLENAKPGTPINLTVMRGGQSMDVSVEPVAATRRVHTVVSDPAASAAARVLGEEWLARKTPSAQ